MGKEALEKTVAKYSNIILPLLGVLIWCGPMIGIPRDAVMVLIVVLLIALDCRVLQECRKSCAALNGRVTFSEFSKRALDKKLIVNVGAFAALVLIVGSLFTAIVQKSAIHLSPIFIVGITVSILLLFVGMFLERLFDRINEEASKT